jgi:phospholipid/cholesterol/gamma-HCH transport system substrate-binding protein
VSKEFKTGIIAILIIALFIWGYNFLKDKKLYDTSRTFYAEYTNVQGLVINAPVTISGLKVGKVSKITFHPYKKGVLVTHINLSNKIKFSKNSIAQIYSPDFISGKSLKIKIADDSSEFAKDGDTLIGNVDSGILGMINEQIAPLQSKVESFVVNTDSVMKNLNEILSEQNQENLNLSLLSLRLTLEKFNSIANKTDVLFEENHGKFDSIFNNANIAMKNFSQITDSLQKANLGATVTRLQQTLESFNRILDGIENGNGTFGKLMKDEELYNNLTNTTKELEELLREVKLHPKRFVHLSVFGKKDKGYQKNVEE